MKISTQPGYRTREITLSEFISDYMNTGFTPYELEPKDNQGNIMQPIIGFLTVYDMDYRPSMEAVFLFPDRLVYMYVYISRFAGIEPYPNPMYQTIKIDKQTEYKLERNDNYTNLVISWNFWESFPMRTTKAKFSIGPEVDCFCRAFLLVRHHVSNNIPLPTSNVLENVGFERGYLVEVSIQRFLKPETEISPDEAIRLETAERLHHSKKQAFTKKEMVTWGYSLLPFKDYLTLEGIYQKESLDEFRKMGEIFYRDEENYALYMPITNHEWAIKKANNITRGCLVAIGRRFVLIDFDRKLTSSFYYEDFSGVELIDSQLTINLRNSSSIVISLQLSMGKKITLQWLGIIHGMTDGFGEHKDHKYYNYVMTKEYLDRNAQSMNLSQLFAVTIYSLFVNAMEKTAV